MEELNKKWFQIVWACLLIASISMSYIQRMSDALWAHSEVVQILDRTLMWVMLPLSLVMFVFAFAILATITLEFIDKDKR
jgi:hypothetical protein